MLEAQPMIHNGLHYGHELAAVEIKKIDELALRHAMNAAHRSRFGKIAPPVAIDVGCGTGAYAARLAAKGMVVYGFDQVDRSQSFDAINRELGRKAVYFANRDVATLAESDLPAVPATLVVLNRIGHFLDDREWEGLWDRLLPVTNRDTRFVVNFMSCDHLQQREVTRAHYDEDGQSATYFLRHTKAFGRMMDRLGLEVEYREESSALCLSFIRPVPNFITPTRSADNHNHGFAQRPRAYSL
jgi:SAM-dependent methyltransferase